MPISKNDKLLQVWVSGDLDKKLVEMARSSERSKTQFVRWLIIREYKQRSLYPIPADELTVIQDNDHES